jgi:hypothetical protein
MKFSPNDLRHTSFAAQPPSSIRSSLPEPSTDLTVPINRELANQNHSLPQDVWPRPGASAVGLEPQPAADTVAVCKVLPMSSGASAVGLETQPSAAQRRLNTLLYYAEIALGSD